MEHHENKKVKGKGKGKDEKSEGKKKKKDKFREYHGLRVGVRGVRVRVAELIPSPNPYPKTG